MDFSTAASQFIKTIEDDPRIAPNHISLFMAILYFYHLQNCSAPITIFSRDLMKHAKISGISTYIRCIKDLKEFGYIEYTPSKSPIYGSLITPKSIKE